MSFPDDDFTNGIITGGGGVSQHIEIGVPPNVSSILLFDGKNPNPWTIQAIPDGANPNDQFGAFTITTPAIGPTPGPAVPNVSTLLMGAPSASLRTTNTATGTSGVVGSTPAGAGLGASSLGHGAGINATIDHITGFTTNDGTQRSLVRGQNGTTDPIIFGGFITGNTAAGGLFTVTFPLIFPLAADSFVVMPVVGNPIFCNTTILDQTHAVFQVYNAAGVPLGAGVALNFSYMALGH